MPNPLATPDPPRALALDALRGLAILMMCLSGIVPNGLPNFMYHGYYPRFLPNADGVWQAVANPYQFRADWPSFTWVDWVFPMFLFAMGAAFPFALGRRLDKGVPVWKVVLSILGRGGALVGFAIYVKQIIPAFIEYPTSPATWLLGLLGFALLFPVFARLPKHVGKTTSFAIRAAGVMAAVAFVIYLNTNDGDAFSYAQNDIIILLLAHMSVAGSLIWLVSRNRLWLRLLWLIPIYIAHHRAMHGGWDWLAPVVDLPNRLLDLRWLGAYLPGVTGAPGEPGAYDGLLNLAVLYNFTWYKFLFVVIPGTIIGDLIRKHLTQPTQPVSDLPDDLRPWSPARYLALIALNAALILTILVGLESHGRALLHLTESFTLSTPTATWFAVVPLLVATLWLVRQPAAPHDRLTRSLVFWGAAWLLLGLIAEPFEGGIKKGPPSTISYYLVSVGLSILLLSLLTIWIDILRKPFGTRVLVLNGQNPMLAYVGIRNFLAPLVALPLLALFNGRIPGISSDSINAWVHTVLPASPWWLLAWALAQTVLLALIVAWATRCRLIWRA